MCVVDMHEVIWITMVVSEKMAKRRLNDSIVLLQLFMFLLIVRRWNLHLFKWKGKKMLKFDVYSLTDEHNSKQCEMD